MAALIFWSVADGKNPFVRSLPRDVRGSGRVLCDSDEFREYHQFGYFGVPFPAEEVRRDFYLLSSHKALADSFPVCARWGCSAAFRAEVERLEPGVHQFFPIRITRPRSKKPILRRDGQEIGPDDFFLFNCLQLVDAVLPDLSSGPMLRTHPSGLLGFGVETDDLCVSRAAIAGRHIWHGDFHNRSGAYFFVSDELLAGFRRAGLKGFEVRPVREA
jgi:hypothetical protein